jgi:peptidoglycan/LPS O-acetylase OafA/YrhL
LEEQFYLLWPLIVPLLSRRWLIALSLGLVGLSLAARSAGFHPHILVARFDGFALGGFLAALLSVPDFVRLHGRRLVRVLAIVGGLAIVFLAVGSAVMGSPNFVGEQIARPGPTILALNLCFLALVGLVYLNAGHPLLSPLRNRWLVYLGQISYGIYLYHFIVFAGLSGICDLYRLGNGPLVKVFRWILLIAIPVISWECLEKPILSLRDQFAGYREEADNLLIHQSEEVPLVEPTSA